MTGTNAENCNGTYEPTNEVCDDLPVYQKKGNDTIWLEFNRGLNYWFVRSTSNRGTNKGWAYCSVEVPCLPQDCPASTWKVYNSEEFATMTSLRMQLLSAPPQNLLAMVDRITSAVRNDVFSCHSHFIFLYV